MVSHTIFHILINIIVKKERRYCASFSIKVNQEIETHHFRFDFRKFKSEEK